MKNILMLNAGTRNRLIKDFKRDLAGMAEVIATDSYYLAPALYEADRHFVTKRWDEDGYWEDIFQICRDNQVGMVLSLVDPELEALAKRKKQFAQMGILVNTSNENVVHDCFDKWRVLHFLEQNGYPCIKTYRTYQEAEQKLADGSLTFPLLVKPRCGSGSAGIEKITTRNRLETVVNGNEDLIIQEFMQGQELGVDVYIDLISGEVISIFAKKKLKMRAGETDKSVSYKNEKLFEMISRFAKKFGLSGANDIDVFERDGEFYISEVNPRFGGGYLHAYENGERFPLYLINNMNGIPNMPNVGNYEDGVYMMKYFDVKILKAEE